MSYETLRARVQRTRQDIDLSALDLAYSYAKAAHEGQTRYSGEPYIIHPVAAAEILMDLHPDLATLQACLLHDVTEDTPRTLEDIESEFGAEVAMLVAGCEKLAVVKVRGMGLQNEKWKRMFLAMAKDVRIMFIKLCDRLHNMRTLHHVPEEKQHRIAKESLAVHAAVASRMGMYSMKSELEDLCFRFLQPEAHAQLSEALKAHAARSEEFMNVATSTVEQLLFREGVKVEAVEGRMKHLWSIHQKLQRKEGAELKDIYDLFAVRVILPDMIREGQEQVSHLYSALGLLHHHFIPLQDRFKDYVAVPKPNGYRSLHTALMGIGGELFDDPVEVQIRTYQMHKEAEIGVASHSQYKEGSGPRGSFDAGRHIKLLESLEKVKALADRSPDIAGMLTEWVENYQSMTPTDRLNVEDLLLERGLIKEDLKHIRRGRSQERLTLAPRVEQQLAWLRGMAENMNEEIDLYPNKIFVLTPGRDVIELPRGATPVDFAYAIHTELGHRLLHAKVNGRIVPLDYELRNGEMVEIGKRREPQPSRYWLGLAQTASAKAKIKNWFNRQDRESNVLAGRELLNRQLHLRGQVSLDERLTLLATYGKQKLSFNEREGMLESIGRGVLSLGQVLRVLFPVEENVNQKVVQKNDVSRLSERVLVTGEEDLPVILSACCKPRPPHAIIGYVTRGRSIRVHQQSCRELSGLSGERFVSTHWKASE
jgi:(p)ppGpp synthase/HD superfamily hydrolase